MFTVSEASLKFTDHLIGRGCTVMNQVGIDL